jgi:hypothetical protein
MTFINDLNYGLNTERKYSLDFFRPCILQAPEAGACFGYRGKSYIQIVLAACITAALFQTILNILEGRFQLRS